MKDKINTLKQLYKMKKMKDLIELQQLTIFERRVLKSLSLISSFLFVIMIFFLPILITLSQLTSFFI